MASLAAVGVDDDFAPRQPAVANRATDYEVAGWVDEQIAPQLLGVIHRFWQYRNYNVLPEVIGDPPSGRVGVLVMLS